MGNACLSLFLSLQLLAANTLCACLPSDQHNPDHAHHQTKVQGIQSCTAAGCGGCEAGVGSADRNNLEECWNIVDGTVTTPLPIVYVAGVALHQRFPRAPPGPSATPITRHDTLLH